MHNTTSHIENAIIRQPSVQEFALNLQATVLAFAMTSVPPVDQMSQHRPAPLVSVFSTYVMISMMVVLFATADVASMVYMSTRPWYGGGNGTTSQVTRLPLLLQMRVTRIACCGS